MDKIRQHIRQTPRLCLFGVGTLLEECFHQLANHLGRMPDYLCDNAESKWGRTFFGVPCISPEQLGRLADDTFVVITVRQYGAIREQLRAQGIRHIAVARFDSSYHAIHGLFLPEDDEQTPGMAMLSQEHLRGRWALITGASRGVGRQIALALARLGANIIAHSRSESHVETLAAACAERGIQVVPIAAELADSAAVDRMLDQLTAEFPAIDYLFNNAAISPPCNEGFWRQPADAYRVCFQVNAIAPISICRRLIPPMIERGFGRVVNVNTHIQKRPDEMAYACSKAALDKFVHDLAPSLDNSGVMICLADPGWVKTDAGGPHAQHPVESVIPGMLLGALLEENVNGRRFSAQEYAGLGVMAALHKAQSQLSRYPELKWI